MTDSQPHVDTQVLLSPGGSGAGAQRARTHEGGNDSNALNADEKADAEGDGQSILPQFGRKLREEYWSFEEGWTNLNHGAYGAAPIPVIKAFHEIQNRCAAAPDRWMRREYGERLVALRVRMAEFVGCDTDDLVFVSNATTGMNAVLHSLTTVWEKGDKLLYFSTSVYRACFASLQLVVDSHPHLSLSLVPVHLDYLLSHAKVLEATRRAIAEEEGRGGRIRLALVDALSSNPGVVVPWEELTGLFREHKIISLIDAAHQLGQLPVNLRKSKPDYWVSNCHKWFLGHQSCAVLYVAKPNQHLVHALPTGHTYVKRSPAPEGEGTPAWVSEFLWNGTVDYSPILSVAAAFDFRKFCGGEERINDYCHRLAIEGGEAVARILGTDTMRNPEGEGELVANMMNVRLPIPWPASDLPPAESIRIQKEQKDFFLFTQIDDYKTLAAGFTHAGQWWVRLSAQIYNDLEDFETVGNILVKVCERIRNGEFASTVNDSDSQEAPTQRLEVDTEV